MAELYRQTPAYLDALQKTTAACDRVIAVHPFVHAAVREVTERPLWYEAQDFQFGLKSMLLPAGAAGERLIEQVLAAESACCADAELIVVCSTDDAAAMRNAYSIDDGRLVCVPNGVDVERFARIDDTATNALRRRLGLNDAFACLFIGSWHGPNLEAIEWLLQAAPQLTDFRFLVAGSACWAFTERAMPGNVALLGEVEDDHLEVCLQVVHMALNPIAYGTGTNLKMLEYLAAGLPVITTPVGLRGLPLRDGVHVSVAELDGFVEAIAAAPDAYEAHLRRASAARVLIREQFNWKLIARNFADDFLPVHRVFEDAVDPGRLR